MPTEYWYPISSAPHNLPAGMDAFNLFGRGNKNLACVPGGSRSGPPTHDDDTTAVDGTTNETYIYQALNISWPSPMLSFGATFTAGGRHRYVGGAVAAIRRCSFVNAAGSAAAGDFVSVSDSSVAYATTGPIDVSAAATYRPGGGSWGVADFADDQTIFVRLSEGNSPTGWVTGRWTSVFGQIQYTSPSGGLVFMLGLTGLGALPLAGALVDLAHFRRFLSWRRRVHPRHTILTGDEVRQAWDELRACRHPRFFLPALA